MTVHWIVTPGTSPAAQPQVELTARLTGPYPGVADLKNASIDTSARTAGTVTFEAAPVWPAGAAEERPVSVIAIPAEALPGYYNLVTSVRQGGGSAGGATVVRVAPGA